MQRNSLRDWQHNHDFAVVNTRGERRTWYVLVLTAVTMVVEIVAGTVFGSMALLADGWHMGTHVAAFFIALFTYHYARKHANDPTFAFGTGKVNVLGGFASAVALAVVALFMLVESVERVLAPEAIRFNQAILVAVIGLIINLVSALLLRENHHHHGPDHSHGHQRDHNLRAAYLHVVADAITSVLAIVALAAGKYLGWQWLDPVMGIVGAVIITRWAYGLVSQTGPVLLDASVESDYRRQIIRAIEQEADNRVYDLHIWQVGANHYAAIIALVTHHPRPADSYKTLLTAFPWLSHVTVEVNRCVEEPCDIHDGAPPDRGRVADSGGSDNV